MNEICEMLTFGKTLTNNTFSGKSHHFNIPKVLSSDCELKNIEFFVEKFRSVLEKACKGKSEIALALSAGKDSRVLLGLLRSIDVNPTCVTWSYKETDPEVKDAKKICESFGLTHKYIPIKPEMYFVEENIIELLKLSDGNPLYFPMMLWYGIKDQLNYDVVFCGNLMTEYMDTAEYRKYEGKDIAKALLLKETVTDILTDENYTSTYERLWEFYKMTNLNQIIVSRMIDRITQYHVMRKFINWNYPILDEELLRELFMLPIGIRMGSKLTRMMMKQYFPELLKFPTGRSPFSARYPLIMHQAYAKATKRKISKGLEHLLPPLLEKETFKFDYGFIDNGKVRRLLDSPTSKKKTMGITRLLNLQKWEKYKEVI
jgi:asparagine synthetase B (glutamine-hydrolysing)